MATKGITDSADAQRAKTAIRSLADSGTAIQAAAAGFGAEFRRLESEHATATKRVTDARAEAVKAIAESKRRLVAESKALLDPLRNSHARVSAVLDTLLERLARAKNTLG